MKAALYDSFRAPLHVESVPDPVPTRDGVVIRVLATGVCRSDWHGWQGHDDDIKVLPHVPGHELAGVIAAVGSEVRNWRIGDRVTTPFVLGCGTCAQCLSGNHQICDRQWQPGFHGWGSFAEYVALPFADVNLVRLPETLDYAHAAILGCRFGTSWRGIVAQGNVRGGEWVAVHGCGGVGLSAVMIAAGLGAQVIGVDLDPARLELARELGAAITINAREVADVPLAIKELTAGGAHVSVDALGSVSTARNSILCLRKRGRHIQIGLLAGEHRDPPLPMGAVIGRELELYGSHGMQAFEYERMLRMITSGKLPISKLVGQRVGLDDAPEALMAMDNFPGAGITVVEP
ncbi:MAG: zinc-dependent alcohol dehydrogenase family protein [Anaerolineae bacterium]|nr:zinc-dependent alcohol dehydrogenase family protein [Anaerolineae bacterium]